MRFRMGRSVVGALMVLLLAIPAWACSDDGETAGTQEEGETIVQQDGLVETVVGEKADLGDVMVLVTGLFPTEVVTLPEQVVGVRSGVQSIADGAVFYQARVRVVNRGGQPVRVDPLDFRLAAGGRTYPPDAGRSGPPARTLLAGASFDLILTFRIPEGVEPKLRYSPQWFDGSIVIEGRGMPAGLRGTEEGER